MSEYDGKQFVGIDLHRQRSVIVWQTDTGEQLVVARIVNAPNSLALQLEKAGEPSGGGARPMAGTGRVTPCKRSVLRCTSYIYWASGDCGTGG